MTKEKEVGYLLEQFKKMGYNYEFIGEEDFLKAIQALKEERADMVYGPLGGMLSLDATKGVVITGSTYPNGKLYFGINDYLGIWKLFKLIENNKEGVLNDF